MSSEALARPEVEAFVRYYLENAVSLADDADYVPAPEDGLAEALAKLPAAG